MLLFSSDDALDSIGESRNVEVDEEPLIDVEQPKIGEKLRLVDGYEVFDGLEFKNEPILHNHVEAMPTVKLEALVGDCDTPVGDKCQPGGGQFVAQAALIDGLQQAGPQVSVDLDGAPDHAFNEGIPDERH